MYPALSPQMLLLLLWLAAAAIPQAGSQSRGRKMSCFCSICIRESTCKSGAGCFISAFVDNNMQLKTERRGCIQANFGTMNHLTCDSNDISTGEFFYCCFSDDCNSPLTANWTIAVPEGAKELMAKRGDQTNRQRSGSTVWIPVLFCVVAIVLFVCWVALSVFLFSPFVRNRVIQGYFAFKEKLNGSTSCSSTPLILLESCQEIISPSNSGTGDAWMQQPSISKQIKLEKLIATGRYAHVMRGIWNYQDVAVKILFPSESEMGAHEAKMYHQYHLRHENLLCFIASDCNDRDNWLQTWLIFDYHPRGSLYDYLESNRPNVNDMFRILTSVTAGLLYLHTEIVGNMGKKPSIAHRDVKTKNVLMKMDGSCCISDLGISIAHDNLDLTGQGEGSQSDTIEHGDSERRVVKNSSRESFMASFIGKKVTGTKRFLAPELLTLPPTVPSFEYLLKVDIYALGLLFWEVVHCTMNDDCFIDGYQHNHRLAYEDLVKPDPSLSDMHELVVNRGIRPELAICWEHDQVFKGLGMLMSECWYHKPESRPRIAAIKLSLGKITNQIPQSELP